MAGRIRQGGKFFGDEPSVFRPVSLKIGRNQWSALGHRDFRRPEMDLPATRSYLALADRSQVPCPVRVASRSDEILLALVIQRQDRHPVPTAGSSATYGECRREPKHGQNWIHDLVIEEA